MLDPNIILQGQLPQLDNPIDTARQVQSLKQMQNLNAIGDIGVTQAQRGEADEAVVRRAFQNNMVVDESGNLIPDRKGIMQTLYKEAPERAMQVQSQWIKNEAEVQKQLRENQKVEAEANKANAEAQHTNLTGQLEKVNKTLDILGTSVDQQTWTANRDYAIANKLTTPNQVPETFDPVYRDSMLKSSAGAKATLENQTKQVEEQIKGLALQNTLRHEQVTEKQAAIDSGRQQYNANREATKRITSEFLDVPIVKKVFPIVKENYDKLQALGKSGSLSDYGLLEGLLRLYNPDRSVSLGNIKSAMESVGAPSKIIAWANKVDKGGILEPGLRKAILDEGSRIYNVQRGAVEDLAAKYRARLARDGLNPEDLPDITSVGGVKGSYGRQVLSSAEAQAMSDKYKKPIEQIVADARAAGFEVK